VKKDSKFKPGNKAGQGRGKGTLNKTTAIKTAVRGIMQKIANNELTVQSWEDIEKYVYTVIAYDGLSHDDPKVRLKLALELLPFMKAAKQNELQDAGAKGLQINLFAPSAPDNPYLDKSKEVKNLPVISNPVKENAAISNKG